MNTNRLFVSLNSAVVIVAVMFYLSGITMAADHPKEAKPAEKTPPPQQDTFGDDGTPTFEDTPSPTFQPPPPVPAKHDDKNKEEKREKGKKDKGDGGGIGLLAVTDPDLTVIGATVTPEGNGPGDSGTLGTAATLTVVIKNQGSTDATDFRLDVWFKHPSTAPPPNFGSTGDVGIVIPLLAAGASLTTSYSFTFPIVKQAYRAWAQ